MRRPSLPTTLLAVALALPVRALVSQDARAGDPSVPPRPAGSPAKTWERELVRALRPTPAGTKYQLNVSESPIEAGSVPELLRRMNEASDRMVELKGGRSPGSYSWQLGTPWTQETHLSRCQFKQIDVRLGYDLDVVMLAGPVAQDSAAVAWHARWLDQLWKNHLERLRAMRDASKGLHQELRLMSNGSCSELANIANQKAREVRFRINERMGALGGRTIPLADRDD